MSALPPWLSAAGVGLWLIRVHVQPRASRTEVVGTHGDRLKIRVQAPPVDGAANEELRRFLAERLGVPASAVELARGASSRAKDFRVGGREASKIIHALS